MSDIGRNLGIGSIKKYVYKRSQKVRIQKEWGFITVA